MKNRLMFLLLTLFCASSTLYGVKITDESSDSDDEIKLNYVDKNQGKNLYPNLSEINSDEFEINTKTKTPHQKFNYLDAKNNDGESITTKISIDDNKRNLLKEQPTMPTVLTIATFSIISNAFLGFATQALNISSKYSFILFLTTNWGLKAWYKSRIKKDEPKNTQQNAPKNFVNNFGIKLKPYCSSTHFYTAIPIYILASACTGKTMNYLFKK